MTSGAGAPATRRRRPHRQGPQRAPSATRRGARPLRGSKARGTFTRGGGQTTPEETRWGSSPPPPIKRPSSNTGNERGEGAGRGKNSPAAPTPPAMTYRTTGIRQDGEVIIADG